MHTLLFSRVLVIAYSVGMDSNNPLTGLPHDSDNELIVETICDVAQGKYRPLAISRDDLSENQRVELVQAFQSMVYDR